MATDIQEIVCGFKVYDVISKIKKAIGSDLFINNNDIITTSRLI